MRILVAIAIATATATCLAPVASAAVSDAERSLACPAGEVGTASGCTSFGEARREVTEIVNQALVTNDLRAAIVRVDIGERTLAGVAAGESITGVPASRKMHFRIGAMGIPYLVNLLLQLQDEGRLSLDDTVSEWLPGLANADRVTLRMLATSTSGYPDWIQGNPAFEDALFDDVFHQWTPAELLEVAFSQPLNCEPGACFRYAHTNFAILSKILHEETGRSVGRLIRRRVFAPLGLRQIQISALPAMPEPVLHAYTSDRGPYEDSTFWSPSWTVGKDTIMSGTVGNIARTARAIGTGALISRRASRDQFSPATTIGYPGFSEDLYFGLGIAVANSWRFQNPDLNGYTGIMAYQPAGDISLALTVTRRESAAGTGVNYSQVLFSELAAYLGHPVMLPGR